MYNQSKEINLDSDNLEDQTILNDKSKSKIKSDKKED